MTTHTLYRFFSVDETLLYVGLTINPGRRMEKHRTTKPWWCDVARITMEQHSDLASLRAAERRAIETEKPVQNIRMNGNAPKREPRPLPSGIRIGEVYAFGLSDGTCPVGLVIAVDEDGVTITPFNWLVSMFCSEDEWICRDLILRWMRAEEMSQGAKRKDGYAVDQQVFAMDALGAFQTKWLNRPS